MIRFLADEDFNNDILRSLTRRLPRIDVVRVQDLELRGASDDEVLARAASERRLVLTHDVNTLLARALERVERGHGHSGVIAVAQSLTVGTVVEDLMLIAECLADDEWRDRIVFLPLK
jgi:hypothetical protein